MYRLSKLSTSIYPKQFKSESDIGVRSSQMQQANIVCLYVRVLQITGVMNILFLTSFSFHELMGEKSPISSFPSIFHFQFFASLFPPSSCLPVSG